MNTLPAPAGNPLQPLLEQLQAATGADLVLIGEVLDSPIKRVQVLACLVDQQQLPGFSYLLATHPCREVVVGGEFVEHRDIGFAFPHAFLLHDFQMRAYAGFPLVLPGIGNNGIAVALARSPWPDPAQLPAQFACTLTAFDSDGADLADILDRARLTHALYLRDDSFREFVLDNPTGYAYTELLPPVPFDLPEEQLIERLMYCAVVLECNQSMARMYGFASPAEMAGRNTAEAYGTEKARQNISFWMRNNYQLHNLESQIVDANGNVRWISGSVFPRWVDGRLSHLWVTRADLTAQKRYEAAIHHKAHYDALTDLPNRYWFQDRLEILTNEHVARDQRLCIGLLDLNGFKEINDTMGHAVGDQILKAVAIRLLKGLKPLGAELSRLGGDEFAILMPEITGPDPVEKMAQTLHRLLAEPFVVEDMQLSVGGSLGLALFPDWMEIGEDLLRLADVAMYAAKKEGRPWHWYHPDIDKHSRRRLSLLNSVVPAIDRGELFLVYQPKIGIGKGELHGFEALLRWRHPQHGLIPPGDFIPLAETSEVILPLTRWVLADAIRQGAEWLRRGHRLTMAVNISVRNLLDERLESFVADALAQYDFPAELLELEITESALMTSPTKSMDILNGLRNLGLSIAIDDFGTGYSSLAYLARLPVTTLKVDQSFVKDMVRSELEAQIVRSIIALAHQCRLGVVAEGVEDEATLAALLEMGCDLAQGYLIARPLEAAQAEAWIGARPPTST